jgi:hypothetical protein
MSRALKKNRFVYCLTAFAVFVFSLAASFHWHAESAKARAPQHCSVCVAAHQMRSGASLTLPKAEAPALHQIRFSVSARKVFEAVALKFQPSRAPPLA